VGVAVGAPVRERREVDAVELGRVTADERGLLVCRAWLVGTCIEMYAAERSRTMRCRASRPSCTRSARMPSPFLPRDSESITP